MKIMCNLCGKVCGLMASTSLATDEGGQLKTYHFCNEEHLEEFARRKGLTFNKD